MSNPFTMARKQHCWALPGLQCAHLAMQGRRSSSPGCPQQCILPCRDDVNHKGEGIDWGQWAITGDDPDFGGTGNPDTGDDYGPAPGEHLCTSGQALTAGQASAEEVPNAPLATAEVLCGSNLCW